MDFTLYLRKGQAFTQTKSPSIQGALSIALYFSGYDYVKEYEALSTLCVRNNIMLISYTPTIISYLSQQYNHPHIIHHHTPH